MARGLATNRSGRDQQSACLDVGKTEQLSGRCSAGSAEGQKAKAIGRPLHSENGLLHLENGPLHLAWIMHVRSFCATGTLCYQGVSHQVKGPIGTLLIRVY